jgi:hypothetical protein
MRQSYQLEGVEDHLRSENAKAKGTSPKAIDHEASCREAASSFHSDGWRRMKTFGEEKPLLRIFSEISPNFSKEYKGG